MSPKAVAAAVAVNNEIANFRDLSVALIGMVDEMRAQIVDQVSSREPVRLRLPAKKHIG